MPTFADKLFSSAKILLIQFAIARAIPRGTWSAKMHPHQYQKPVAASCLARDQAAKSTTIPVQAAAGVTLKTRPPGFTAAEWGLTEPLYRLAEGFRKLGVRRTKGHELINSGKLRTVKIGRTSSITAESIAEVLNEGLAAGSLKVAA